MATQEDRNYDASADALEALASGEDTQTAQPSQTAPAPPAQSDDGSYGLSDNGDEAEILQASSAPSTQTDRRTRAAQATRQAEKVHAEQFKKTMVPLLLVCGGLLLLLAIVAAVVLATRGEGAGGGMFSPTAQKFMILLALPLGAALLAGAWFFHRELSTGKED